jgi:hypothetical protein
MGESVSLMKNGMFYIAKGDRFIIGRGSGCLQIFVKNISAESMAPVVKTCGELTRVPQ